MLAALSAVTANWQTPMREVAWLLAAADATADVLITREAA
jgi:hypothetical protein